MSSQSDTPLRVVMPAKEYMKCRTVDEIREWLAERGLVVSREGFRDNGGEVVCYRDFDQNALVFEQVGQGKSDAPQKEYEAQQAL